MNELLALKSQFQSDTHIVVGHTLRLASKPKFNGSHHCEHQINTRVALWSRQFNKENAQCHIGTTTHTQRIFPHADNAPGCMIENRRSLVLSFLFFKFHLHVVNELSKQQGLCVSRCLSFETQIHLDSTTTTITFPVCVCNEITERERHCL